MFASQAHEAEMTGVMASAPGLEPGKALASGKGAAMSVSSVVARLLV